MKSKANNKKINKNRRIRKLKRFNGADEAKKRAAYNGSAQLPAGAYICKILGAKESENGYIEVQFDVAEGENKDFFQKAFKDDTREDKKYKGKANIWIPKDDGSERDEWTKNAFMKWIVAIENSNEGYSWDWDERKWKNKMIGLVFGPTGNVIDGKEVVYTEVHAQCSVDQVKEGTFWKKALELRKRNGYTGTQNSNTQRTADNDDWMDVSGNDLDDLPFA